MSPQRSNLDAEAFQERFANERRAYEQVVLARMGSVLTREDAEDIVSDAIIELAAACPADAKHGGRPWFTRVVLNRAEDFRRARDGRPRSARKPNPDPNAPTVCRRLVSLHDVATMYPRDARALSTDESVITGPLEARSDRAHAKLLVGRALARVGTQHAQLLRLRYLSPIGRSRAEMAAELGLSVTQYEARHTAAWRAFTQAVIDVAPMERCVDVRRILTRGPLMGFDAARVDAHLTECPSCRAYRKSIRLPAVARAAA